ncbi:MAG TPA: beta-ketoacyl synthase N-terminal-like domain-containing protein, partial [Candidatus Nitrosopolaris sp.]|nr:beta-ketoacyl synthase N-terminal-like domain-containing protein [Candidatus Nitrosopolaris sp.]
MTERYSQPRTVAVTGLGTINSAGNNVKDYWDAVTSGRREGIITNERAWLLAQTPDTYHKKLRSSLIGRVKSDDLAGDLLALEELAYQHFDRKYIDRYLSESAILGAIAAAEAMRDAKAHRAVDPKRLAFVLGTGIGGGIEISTYQSVMEAGGSLP